MSASVLEKVTSLEAPHNWGLEGLPNRPDAKTLIGKLDRMDGLMEPWDRLCVDFNLAYLKTEDEKFGEAMEILKKCESVLKDSKDPVVQRYKEVFESVYVASRECLVLRCPLLAEAKQFADLELLKPPLSQQQLSALNAIKARIFMDYGLNGTQKAEAYATEALKYSPNEGNWHFLMGWVLSRLRHFSREHMPSKAELDHMEKAFDITETPKAAIFLANIYSEKCKCMKFKGQEVGMTRESRAESNELATKAKNLFMWAIEQNNDECQHMMIRCAYGLKELPNHLKDTWKAKALLMKALRRSPMNPLGNKLAGDFCLYQEQPQYEEALKYYQLASSINEVGMELKIFEINIKLGNNPNPEELYSRLLNSFQEESHQRQILLHAIEHYVFFVRESGSDYLFEALKYFLKLIEIDPKYDCLKYKYVNHIRLGVNFYDLLTNEARLYRRNNFYISIEKQNILENVLSEVQKHDPQLLTKSVEENMIERLISEGAGRNQRGGHARGNQRSGHAGGN